MSPLPAATTSTNKNIYDARNFVEASSPWEKVWIKCPFFEYSRGYTYSFHPASWEGLEDETWVRYVWPSTYMMGEGEYFLHEVS